MCDFLVVCNIGRCELGCGVLLFGVFVVFIYYLFDEGVMVG